MALLIERPNDRTGEPLKRVSERNSRGSRVVSLREGKRGHQALIRNDAGDVVVALRVSGRKSCAPVSDRAGDVFHRHAAAVRFGLQAAAIAAAMVDEVEPDVAAGKTCVRRLCLQGPAHESRQITAFGHVDGRLNFDHVLAAALDDGRLRAQAARPKRRPADGSCVLDDDL